ncbi:MAG: hypothetical protein MZU95_00975 [Desulfomicrobium escambiense]|nr:hypothetical protein [Desulfomicrobium escambiense]
MHRSHEYLCKIAVEVMRRRLHPLPGRQPEARRHPRRSPRQMHRRPREGLLRREERGPGRLPARHALRRPARSPAAFHLPPELRLLAHDHRPRPRRCGRLLRHVRSPDHLRQDPASQGTRQGACSASRCMIDWTFYCFKCDGMASLRTCPHGKEDRVLLSGTMLRKMLSEGSKVPDHFGRDEVLEILRDYYKDLDRKGRDQDARRRHRRHQEVVSHRQ